jgi:hypothetical protein
MRGSFVCAADFMTQQHVMIIEGVERLITSAPKKEVPLGAARAFKSC